MTETVQLLITLETSSTIIFCFQKSFFILKLKLEFLKIQI